MNDHPTASLSGADRRVGVVIPVYNRRTILLETLEHVLTQSQTPERLVIVDDGSTDGTPDAVEEFLTLRAAGLDWRLIRCGHSSAAAARNAGFQQVGDLPFTAFLDSDDHWPTDFLERLVEALLANPLAVAASTLRRYVDSQGIGVSAADARDMPANPVPWFFKHGAGVASCTLLRSRVVQAVGGWKPELEVAEDSELFCSVAMQGKWLHTPGPAVTFHLGNAPDRNEEANLSRRYADGQRRWAVVYERIYKKFCEARPGADQRPLRAALAYRWSAAGKQQLALGDPKRARELFARALRWDPAHFKSWRRLAGAAFRRAA